MVLIASLELPGKCKVLCAELKIGIFRLYYERLWSPQINTLLLDHKYPQLSILQGIPRGLKKVRVKEEH